MNIRAGAVALSMLMLTAIATSALLIDHDEKGQSDALAVDSSAALPIKEDGVSVLVRKSAEPSEEAIGHSAGVDWLSRYHESTDDFALARDLGDAAVAGDARVEYLLGQVLLRCQVQKIVLAPYAEGTVAERIELHLANGPSGPEHSRARFRREASRCERLFSEDPFAGQDLPDEARGFGYWSKLAVESGDPRALMDRAFRTVAGRPASSDVEKDRVFREALMADVRMAFSSRDPAALFAIGGLFSYPTVTAKPEQGYAWQVAACEAGYDCSLANPDWGFACVESGACLVGETLLDAMQRDFGSARYAEIYAKAQDIQYKIKTNDWDGLQQYLEIK